MNYSGRTKLKKIIDYEGFLKPTFKLSVFPIHVTSEFIKLITDEQNNNINYKTSLKKRLEMLGGTTVALGANTYFVYLYTNAIYNSIKTHSVDPMLLVPIVTNIAGLIYGSYKRNKSTNKIEKIITDIISEEDLDLDAIVSNEERTTHYPGEPRL